MAPDELEQLLNQPFFMPLQFPAPSEHQKTQKVALNHFYPRFYPLFFLLVLSRAAISLASQPNRSCPDAPPKTLTPPQSSAMNRWDTSSTTGGGGMWTMRCC